MAETFNKLLLGADGGPRDRIVGFETEYAADYITPDGLSDNRIGQAIAQQFSLTLNRKQFQASGERIYLDVGSHPEYATAEETSFLGAAHRLASGHVKIAKMIAASGNTVVTDSKYSAPLGRAGLVANSCTPSGVSWGNHENFLASRALNPEDYIAALAVHHLSRIVWSGAGSVAQGRNDYRFTLSERADHIWNIANEDTTSRRALVNLRDEALADRQRFRRIHIIAGESVFSPFTNALRLASGSIVLRACELGTVDFSDLIPENPLLAMRVISGDPTLKATVEMKNNGPPQTGLDLQRAIAKRCIEATTKANYLTDQEKEWGVRWEQVINDLEFDPESCAHRVDWIVKQKLIERELAANREQHQSSANIAWSKSIDYHRILPEEGAGMKLLRRGFFEDSPTEEMLKDGLPLPLTRAKLRGTAIEQFNRLATDYYSGWEAISITNLEHVRSSLPFELTDPYKTTEPELEGFLSDQLRRSTIQV